MARASGKGESARNQRNPPAKKATLQGVSRALDVLELLASRPMRASRAAEVLEMPWATLHRTLAQLEEKEFIERDHAGVYRIGRRTWLLGSTYLVGHALFEHAVPVVRRAAEDLPLGVLQLVERSDFLAVVLYSHEGQSGEVITRTTYGYHFPLHCGSKGQLLLAYSDDEYVDHYLAQPLTPMTPDTVTDPAQLRTTLAAIREQGYARTVGDVQPFTGSVSAPVWNADGAVVAAVCAVVPREQMDEGVTERRIRDTAQRCAHALSLGLGWRPGQNY